MKETNHNLGSTMEVKVKIKKNLKWKDQIYSNSIPIDSPDPRKVE
jgi:hypothetical protein